MTFPLSPQHMQEPWIKINETFSKCVIYFNMCISFVGTLPCKKLWEKLISNSVSNGCTRWLIEGDGVHDVCCHKWHMRCSLFAYNRNVMQHHTCYHSLTCPLRRHSQTTKAVEPRLDDPKCHFYPDPALTQSCIKAALRWSPRVRIGGHQVPCAWVASVPHKQSIEQPC